MATDTIAPTQDLVRFDHTRSVVERIRGEWDPANVELIRTTVAKDCNAGELSMFLELCARYQMDPFAGQIYAAKIKDRVAIIVSHAGMTAICERHDDYLGVDSDVVRANDFFRKYVEKDGTPIVEHEYRDAEGNPTADIEKRGAMLGAWAICRRQGRVPKYFFAPRKSYDSGKHTWASHPDAMMVKVPELLTMRKSYPISGIVGDVEVENQRVQLTSAPSGPDYGEDPQVAAKLEQLFDLLDYKPRKRVVRLAGQYGTGLDPAGLVELVNVLLGEAKSRGIDVPLLDFEQAPEGDGEPDESISEAEVVG